MDVLHYLQECFSFSLQIIPAMLLFFLCVPEGLFRSTKKKTLFECFFICGIACCGAILAEPFILSHTSYLSKWNYRSILMIVAAILAGTLAHRALRISTKCILKLLAFITIWDALQYILSNLLIIALRQYVYNSHAGPSYIVSLSFFLTTLILFPSMLKIFIAPFREYLMNTERLKHRPIYWIVLVESFLVTMIMAYIAWINQPGIAELLLYFLICLSMLFVIWTLLHYMNASVSEQRVTMQMLTTQIRPHFIYNTMNTIYNLCNEDVALAKRAIYDFSNYLRINFESIENTEPIWFEQELEHIKFYLSLEKLRFRDEITVNYDIGTTHFQVPPLTVQVLVENAICHGLRKRIGPGTLTLRTRETKSAYQVIIEDDGVGFDTSAMRDNPNGEKFIGIRNSRSRLQDMCGGSLRIESIPGKGTKATIIIPKNKEKPDEISYS